ncbi:MAG: SMI1/KNR4 family protein [Planctomycetaceae bacterium]|jgi:hypothetical protein
MDLQLHIEELIGFAFPEEYLQLLSKYPAALMKRERAGENSECEGFINTVELMSDLADVSDINHEVRLSSILDPDGNEFLWPDQVLVIGENGEGDYYGIDLTQEYQGVLLFDHQEVEFEEITDTLDEYVELLQQSFPA